MELRFKKKKMVDYQKLWKYTKIIEVLNRFIALELWFTMEKLWYYGKHYGIIPKTMEIWFTMEKKMVLE